MTFTDQEFMEREFEDAHVLINDEGEFFVSAYDGRMDYTASKKEMMVVGDLDYPEEDDMRFIDLLNWMVHESGPEHYPSSMTVSEVEELVEKIAENDYL